ncbi:4-hydroxybenzoate octaprenyltransferase [Methylophaga thiooxydans]|uniref:4-hydroxybenzoate octaprenyltransferase n=1 Tax=Methylophaga thiooxydans DMS010 TaxID=637616 RepID=C0N6Q1_9GAMM|nr:4-hydroxybenzoate octaprenyltransferase [Methylophaga thiooxydans]EEF79671.1 4-hydroxybenzoate polyprenyl transferase [Methylophaga thiooxydans DMS010]
MSKLKSAIWPYVTLMRLDRPIGILLLLWPTLGALWIAAEGFPDLTVLLVFILGVIIMRSAGCAINDFADRDIDGKVWRTESRPLATGQLQAKHAVILFVVLAIIAFCLVSLLNTMTIWLSLVAVLLAASYPFMKRFTHLPQLYLGIAFGWAIPMAFAAQTETIPTIAWLLFLANIIWTTVYDTFYAMADRDDDLLAGIKSTAVLFGDDDLKIQGVLQASYILVMVLIGKQLEMSWVYYLAVVVAAGFFVYQQYLSRHRDAKACLRAFLNNNWLGGCLFAGIVLHYMMIVE